LASLPAPLKAPLSVVERFEWIRAVTAIHPEGSQAMGDKKYVKLNPKNMGVTFLGVLPPKRQSLLLDTLRILKRAMRAGWASRLAAKEIFWLNLWQDEDDIEDDSEIMAISDQKIAKALDKWCRKATRKFCGRRAILDGYGFVVNPLGSQHQLWHGDYTTDAAVVWIPITPFTDKNAVQCITLPQDTPKAILEAIASNVDEVDVNMVAHGVDYLIVQQMVAPPMSVLYMGRGTIHRGVPNTGREHRIAFFLSVHFIKDYDKNYPYKSHGLESSEPGVAIFGK